MREPVFPGHVIAAFDAPPGWPTPIDPWVIDNQFWSPPADWTPRRGLQAAPSGWIFWDPKTTEFSKWVAPAVRGYTVMAWLASVAVVVAGLIWVVGAGINGPNELFLWAAGVVVLGTIAGFFAINLRRGHREAIIYRLAELAPTHRRERLDARYDEYVQRWREGARGTS